MRYTDIQPTFVIVIGGAGSGKNYFIRNHPTYSKYSMVDVDELKKTVELSAAIGQVKVELTNAMKARKNIVHPTAGSSYAGNLNKIKLAKSFDYRVVLILRDTPIDVAVQNVEKRAWAGGHNVPLEKIISSNKKARENFDLLASLADEAHVV